MKLLQVRLVGLGPFEDVTVSLRGPDDEPRSLTVVFGGGGVGKTTLLSAIAATRPGHAVVPSVGPGARSQGFAVADWYLGDDDPERPHPLRVASPQTPGSEDPDQERIRRQEQGLFDRRAAESGGFVVVGHASARWFSRTPVNLTSPARTVLRWDVRAPMHFDDATRSDLTRETKQALVFAAMAARLPDPESGRMLTSFTVFDEAMRDVLHRLLSLACVRYAGVDPVALEPMFVMSQGEILPFDRMPTSVRHLAGIAALTVRSLFAAYPGRDPRMTEGLVLIDEVALHQEPAVQRSIAFALRAALPRVQWILTTSSPELTTHCEPGQVVALRRLPSSRRVELFEGPLATLH